MVSQDMVKVIGQSSILNFLAGLNNKIVAFFFNSMTYKIFETGYSFIYRHIARAAPTSKVISVSRNALHFVSMRDVGFFIVLTVIFNTAILIFLGTGIDTFSVIARIVFFGLGLILILKKR